MADEFPRKVFRVQYRQDRTPYVAERVMVSRNGSWFTTQLKDGTVVKENGNRWSSTVREAMEREAFHIMNRYLCPKSFDQNHEYDSMCLLLSEAFEWGKLVGEVNGPANRRDTNGA